MKKVILIILILIKSKFAFTQFPLSYKSINSAVGIPYRIDLSYDSGVLVSGANSFNVVDSGSELIKFDANGKKLWTREFNGKVYNRGNSFKQCSDGGYLIFGTTYSTDMLGDGFVAKLNPCGELIWGHIFKIPEWNWITDVKELDSEKLLIVQSGNSFRTNEFLFSHVGIYNLKLKNYINQFLLPTEPLIKKLNCFNGRFYIFNTWSFPEKNNPGVAVLGSSGISFDSTLSNFGIRFYQPESISDTLPLFICPPVFLENGHILSGGSMLGLRSNIGYPMALGKFDKHLNWIGYKDMGHIKTPKCSEMVEHILPINSNLFVALVNNDPNHDYVSTMNSQAEAYLIDSNLNEIKSIIYGDTVNYKYWIHDAINVPQNNILVLMHRFKNFNDISYEIVKLDSNLNLVKTNVPSKIYDYKCNKQIDTIGYINVNQFESFEMLNWNNIAKNTNVSNFFNKSTLNIFPIPSDNYTYLHFEVPESGKVTIINSQGELVFTKQFVSETEFAIDLIEIKNGIYFLLVDLNGKSIYQPILIQH